MKDAERIKAVLPTRLAKYKLELAPTADFFSIK